MPGRAAGPISIEDGSKRATQPLATTAAVSSTPASDETPVVRGELAERFSSQPLALRRAGAYLGLPIRDVPVATWILAKNPETAGNAGLDYGRVDPAELRIVRIRLVKPDGGRLFIDKLERLARLTTEGLQVGSPMFLAYPELGLAAHGEILSIDACPPIPPRPGPDHCLITSKFVHEAATLVELHVAGLAAPILVTPNHPLWSEDRREFVRADHLAPGEHLRSALDEPLIVTAVVPRERPAPVYNLEVDGEHVYFVSPAGVLAHNTGKSPECDGDAVAPNKAVIGKLKDLENLRPGENTLLKHLPDQGSPKANWAQNSSVLRQEMNKGLPIRDGSVNPVTGALENNTGVTELPQRIHSATRGW